jgi:S1-C subfamily serine protease
MTRIYFTFATIGALTLSSGANAQDPPAKTQPPTQRAAPAPEAEQAPVEDEEAPAEKEISAAEEATPEADVDVASEKPAVEPEKSQATPEVEVATKAQPPTAPALPVGSQCTAKEIRRAAELGKALAHVEAPGARGTGFVFHSRRHVLTAASVVDTGRGIRVRFEERGRAISASVVAIDEANDLALLELASPAPAEPLPLAKDGADVGDAVMTLSFQSDWSSREKLKRNRKYLRARGKHLRWQSDEVVQTGTVTFVSGDRLRTDAGQDNWGAPILSCDGRVVGVATSPISSSGVGHAPVASIRSEVADDDVYWGRWSIFHPHAALVGQIDHTPTPGFGKRDKWLGFSLGTALIGHDRFYMPVRFTATFLVAPELEEPFAERRGYRLQGSAGIGYRLMLKGGAVPFYLVPVIGGTVMYQRTTTERTELWVDEPCPDGGCRANPTVFTAATEDVRVMPTFGGGMQIGPGEASYRFILDTEHTERSVHQLTLGVQF